MDLIIDPDGNVRCLYTEQIDLHTLGRPTIRRGSHVEADRFGRWTADLAPAGGPTLGPFPYRSQALAAERQWLETVWLETVWLKRARLIRAR